MSVEELALACLSNNEVLVDEILQRHQKEVFDVNEILSFGGQNGEKNNARVHASCLVLAIEKSNARIVTQLIQSGAGFETHSPGLDAVIEKCCSTKIESVEKFNILFNCHPTLIFERNQAGYLPLHMAILFDNFKLFKHILGINGVDINSTTDEGEAALHIATRLGSYKIVSLLVANDLTDFNAVDRYKNTALHLAAQRGYLQIFDMLKSKTTAALNAKNVSGYTANEELYRLLLRKCQFGMFEELQGLVQRCNISSCFEAFRDTPLHKACLSKIDAFEKVKFLVDTYPQLLSVRDRFNYLPSDIAVKNQDKSVLSYIKGHIV